MLVLVLYMQVAEVSRRLVSLQALLGGAAARVDVVWMVVREPGLLTADYSQLTQRLLDMKVCMDVPMHCMT